MCATRLDWRMDRLAPEAFADALHDELVDGINVVGWEDDINVVDREDDVAVFVGLDPDESLIPMTIEACRRAF